MKTIYGTHGTTTDNAISIQDNGFECGSGLFGFGVYLWAHELDTATAAHEAACSWTRKKYPSKYETHVVIYAMAETKSEYYVDMGEEEFRSTASTLSQAASTNYGQSEAFSLLLDEYQKMLGAEILIYSCDVPACFDDWSPFNETLPPMKTHVIRDPKKVNLRINKVEPV